MRNNEYVLKFSQYETIKDQLFREYRTLKKEIDERVNRKVGQEREFEAMMVKMESLLEQNVVLEQDNKTKDIIIE